MQTTIRQLHASAAPPVTSPRQVQPLFPTTPPANIAANLPHVTAALAAAGMSDTPMLLMALATIRAETESFLPIAEAPSRFNTSSGGHPFDLYDHRTDLGNQGPPDGASFRGRGFVQLTGRSNYTRYGHELSLDLVTQPDLACDSAVAARLLAHFLAARQAAIRRALSTNDLAAARRLVNGGTHGLDRFTAAYRTGETVFAKLTVV